MNGKSSKTTIKSVRIDNDLLAAIISRLNRQTYRPENFNSYVNRILRNEVLRKHWKGA